MTLSPESLAEELAVAKQMHADAKAMLDEWRAAFAWEQELNGDAILRLKKHLMSQHEARQAVAKLAEAQERERMARSEVGELRGQIARLTKMAVEGDRALQELRVRERDLAFIVMDVNRELELGRVPIDPAVALRQRVGWVVHELGKLRRSNEELLRSNEALLRDAAWKPCVAATPGTGKPNATKPKARRKAAKRRRGAR